MAAVGQLESLVLRLEKVTSRLENTSGTGGSSAAASNDDPAYIDEYETFRNGPVKAYMALSAQVGGEVQIQAELVKKVLQSQRDFLGIAARHGLPSKDDLPKLLKPTSDLISEIQAYREKNRKSNLFNHLSVVSEGIPAMGWVAISPKPGNYIKDMTESAMFYINRVIKDHKEKQPKHVEWARSFLTVLTQLQTYVKDFHGIGVAWNKTASPAKPGAVHSSGAAPPPAAVAPPPVVACNPNAAPAVNEGDNRNQLFSSLNQGGDVTKGLKKVTKDMQTHKNPSLRAGSTVPGKSSNTSITAPKPYQAPASAKAAVAKKAPVLELQNKKWAVEFHEGNKDIKIKDTDLNQTVYAYKCNNCVIHVIGKINSVILDGCTKTAIVFDDLVSTCEFINCKSVQAQANGAVPTVSIDKTDGCQVYLNKKSLNADIITAKSSEMNILIPNASGEFSEYPVPEQFRTKWTGSGLKTETLDIAG